MGYLTFMKNGAVIRCLVSESTSINVPFSVFIGLNSKCTTFVMGPKNHLNCNTYLSTVNTAPFS